MSLDAAEEFQVERLFTELKPAIVLMPAAEANVDLCERCPEVSLRANLNAVQNVVCQCRRTGAKLVFLSTDYVFDGANGPYSETDPERPLNVYGRHKLLAEQYVNESNVDSLIVRTSLVYGASSVARGFIGFVADHLRRSIPFRVSAEHQSSPTFVGDLVSGISSLLAKGSRGLYHLSGPITYARFDIARTIAAVLRMDESLILSTAGEQRDETAPRPLKCGLRIEKAIREIAYRPLSLVEGLNRLF